MSRNEIDIFGSICADSTTYASLSDVLHLKNLLSDIDRLFREGEAVIGHLIGKKHQIVARLYKNDDCSCIFRVCWSFGISVIATILTIWRGRI